MNERKEDLILDFTKLDEGLREEGAKLKLALMKLIGLDAYFKMFPVSETKDSVLAQAPETVRGTPKQVEAFLAAAKKEKVYFNSLKKRGADHPSSHAIKSDLDKLVRTFEEETGLIWPLK